MDTEFSIKVIRWTKDYSGDEQFTTPILLQDANGPCPLIALVNSLLIKNDLAHHGVLTDRVAPLEADDAKMKRIDQFRGQLMKYATSTQSIPLVEVLSQLGDLVLFFHQFEPDLNIDDVLNKLSLLHTGLDVNPNLISGTFAGNDLALRLFQLFDLKFRHGWCLNQVDPELDEWPSDYDYETLVDTVYKLQTFDKIQDYLFGDSGNQELVRKWLEVTQTQLTNNGLSRLNINAGDDEVMVFFRNNHFNTLYKKLNQEFYLLVTDSLVQRLNKLIWQLLNLILGLDDLFFTGEFYPVLEIEEDGGDIELAKQLQQQEDEELARKLQEADQRPSRQRNLMLVDGTKGSIPATGGLSKKIAAAPLPVALKTRGDSKSKKSKKKKMDCVVV